MNVAIVGCGFISGIHVNAWKDADQTVVAVCDLNQEIAKQFSKDWNIPSYYTDFSEMLKNEELFAISVCVPPKFHAKIAIKALEAGCNVVVEKPFTENIEDAKKVLDTLSKTKAKMTVIHSQLFEHSIFQAMKKVKGGEIGEVVGMDVGILHSPDEMMAVDKDHWCHKLKGGRFGENLPHPIYLLQAFLGKLEIKSVLPDKLGSQPWMVFDELRVILEAENNRFGTIHISFNGPGHDLTDVHVNIYGTGGTIHAGIYPVSTLIVSKPGRGIMHFGNIIQQIRIWGAYLKNILRKRMGPRYYSVSHVRIIKSFVESILGDGKPLVTPERGFENIQFVEKICDEIEVVANNKSKILKI